MAPNSHCYLYDVHYIHSLLFSCVQGVVVGAKIPVGAPVEGPEGAPPTIIKNPPTATRMILISRVPTLSSTSRCWKRSFGDCM